MDFFKRYGRCEIESAPFECQICNRVVKYDRNTVHTHLKNVHGINWAIYLDRIRKLKRGETPDELPTIEMTECLVCNSQVKYIKEHIKNSHKITEQEYEELFKKEEKVEKVKKKPPKPPKSDIQDKTNKKCSSCDITFVNRRSFIEHCTTVHGMKFKTKEWSDNFGAFFATTTTTTTTDHSKTSAVVRRRFEEKKFRGK